MYHGISSPVSQITVKHLVHFDYWGKSKFIAESVQWGPLKDFFFFFYQNLVNFLLPNLLLNVKGKCSLSMEVLCLNNSNIWGSIQDGMIFAQSKQISSCQVFGFFLELSYGPHIEWFQRKELKRRFSEKQSEFGFAEVFPTAFWVFLFVHFVWVF